MFLIERCHSRKAFVSSAGVINKTSNLKLPGVRVGNCFSKSWKSCRKGERVTCNARATQNDNKIYMLYRENISQTYAKLLEIYVSCLLYETWNFISIITKLGYHYCMDKVWNKSENTSYIFAGKRSNIFRSQCGSFKSYSLILHVIFLLRNHHLASKLSTALCHSVIIFATR